jgi:propanol-preferring alcohol dehydrogenase
MVLPAAGSSLLLQEREDPTPGDWQIRVRVSACGVCRTDLHVVDGELPDIKYPIIRGYEIVGRVDDVPTKLRTGQILGAAVLQT